MKLTAKENAIKQIALEEFRRIKMPGYAEKKHLIEKLDRDWLVDEMDKLQTKGRVLPWILIIGGCLLAIFWASMVVVDAGTTVEKANNVVQLLFAAVLFAGGGVVHLVSRRRRLFLFRILHVIAGGPEPVEQTQPPLARQYESS